MNANLHSLHESAGARLTPDGLLLTYGDVPAEYEAGSKGGLLLDRTGRGRVRVEGTDRVEFLHRLLAGRVRALEPGQGLPNLLLTSKGKVVQAFDLAAESEALVLDTPPAQAAALITALDMYLFTDDVQLVDQTDQTAPIGVVGPRAGEMLKAAFPAAGKPADLPHHHLSTFEDPSLGSIRLAHRPMAGSFGFELDAGLEQAQAVFERLREAGAQPGGRVVEDILRVEAVQAEFGVDVDDNIYPQEARLESAFSLDKGCYIGQEVVAKIDTYGGLNKCLVPLRLSHDDPLPRGTKLMVPDDERGTREVGIVTSWAYSFVLDTGLALGYVKRRHQKLGARFTLESEAGPVPGEAELIEAPVRTGGVPVTGGIE